MKLNSPTSRRGFTLIEVLAAVTIIGILVFLAIPNITAVRRDSEENVAITRASMLNMALASYIQSAGMPEAKLQFNNIYTGSSADKNGARYVLIKPYVAYANTTITQFMPGGYTATLPEALEPLTQVILKRSDGTQIAY